MVERRNVRSMSSASALLHRVFHRDAKCSEELLRQEILKQYRTQMLLILDSLS